MSRGILVIGDSGSGKTTSLRTLDPKSTFYFDADKKGGLNWRGAKKQYSEANGNYLRTSSVSDIWKTMQLLKDKPNIKVIVVDTLNGCMIDEEMRRAKEKNYDRWVDIATSIYGLVANAGSFRDDQTVIFMAHAQTERDEGGFMYTRMKTSGRKLDKICVESKFNIVFLAKGNGGKYMFETNANGSTAKTPLGCFEPEIPNDMKFILDTLDKYENGED